MTKSFSKFLFIVIISLIFPVTSFAELVVTEIMYNPTSSKVSGDWFEIYNNGPDIIVQSDKTQHDTPWKFSKAGLTTKYYINSPDFTIKSGEYVIFSDDSSAFSGDYTTPSNTKVIDSTISLSNSNKTTLQIFNESGSIIANAEYDPSKDFAAGDGNSLQLISNEWKAASPTPGAINATVSNNTSNNTNLDNQNTSGEVLGVSDSSSPSSTSSSGGSTTEKVSTLNAQLEIIAGNDRITSPGSPIWFQATVKKNTTLASVDLSWSFGDGNIGIGPLVSHLYKYPGDYVVVLSSRAGDIFSVSRLKVRVVESDISVSDKGKYLEILNNSNSEINLFNWKIENEGKGFVFQPNTIVLPHSSIKLDKSLLTMKGYNNSLGTSLKNFLGEEIFVVAPVKEVDLNEASKNLEVIKKEAFAIQEKAKNLGFISQNNNLNTQSANAFSTVSVNKDSGDQIDTSMENIIYEVPKEMSTLNKFFGFLINLFR